MTAKISGHVSEERLQRVTRATPGGPEIQSHYFSFRAFQRVRTSGRCPPNREIGKLFTSFFISPGLFLRSARHGIIRSQQVLAQPDLGSVGEAPDIANFPANFFAADVSILSFSKSKSARVLLDGGIQILLKLCGFGQPLGRARAREDFIAGFKILSRSAIVSQFEIEVAAQEVRVGEITLFLLFPLLDGHARGAFRGRDAFDKTENAGGVADRAAKGSFVLPALQK